MFSHLRVIPLLPLLGAVYLILFGRHHSRAVVHHIACMAVGAALVVSEDAFFFGLPAWVFSRFFSLASRLSCYCPCNFEKNCAIESCLSHTGSRS